MNIPATQVLQLLLDGSYISDTQFQELSEYLSKNPEQNIYEYLTFSGYLTKDLFGQAVAESYGLPYADLNSYPPTTDQVTQIDSEIAQQYRVVIFKQSDTTVQLATDSPERLEEIRQFFQSNFPNVQVEVAFSLPEDINSAFLSYLEPLAQRIDKILEAGEEVAPAVFEQIMSEATNSKASDIHMEPWDEEVFVRIRVDGLLRQIARIPKEHYENLLNFVKVQAHLRIDEHNNSQDGAMRYSGESLAQIDLRVSIIPTLTGEKVVIRILASYVGKLTLSELGLSREDADVILDAVHKPFGMVINCGPTGSGKTTTMYALLQILHNPEVNITTIEDPVEYKVSGINQIQVNQLTGLTFAKGLRAVVRQDPNVILVGEIRDNETAEVGINAALTGHLVLSTFHANDAATTIPRLLDMEIEPFLLASTLNVIISQRLTRRICDSCKYSYQLTQAELKEKYADAQKFMPKGPVTLYAGKGCTSCNGSGFKGRIGVYEVIKVTPEMKSLILTNPSSDQVWKLAKEQGATSFYTDGLKKVLTGVTTIEEVARVAPVTS